MRGNFENTGRLIKFIFRRERIISTVWILILVAFFMGVAPVLAEMFSDDARAEFAITLNNPIMVAMMGPIYGADNYTTGAMYTGMMLLWSLIAIAIMNIFFVVRHTRDDEEYGRIEVVRSLPTGRLASIHATMIVAVIINFVLGLLTTLSLAVLGIEGMDFIGSMFFGAAIAVTGLVFAAIAALFSQLSSNKSGATGYSLFALGVFYMIRAAGDMQGNEILSCISPLGLVLRSQAYIENNVWPLLVLLAIAIVISAVAYRLNAIRDMGQGFISARRGRAMASKGLLSSFGLSWRLLRKTLIVWAIVMFVLGASYASVVGDIGQLVGDSEEYLTILGVPVEMLTHLSPAEQNSLIVESFAAFVSIMMTLVCIVPLLNAVMRARSEERDGRAELVISRSIQRCRYLAGYIILAFIASAVLQFLTGSGLYITAAALVGDENPFTFAGIIKEYLVYLPALWIMIGFAVFMIGVFPKATGVVWGYFGIVAFTSFIGRLILPDWMMNISPFHFTPQPEPFREFVIDFPPLIIMTAIAAALVAVGVVFYRRRDLV